MSHSLLREYLELEFAHVPTPGFSMDLERIVDDFVLFCMLIGNDFLPGEVPHDFYDTYDYFNKSLRSACSSSMTSCQVRCLVTLNEYL